jgi:hypothetical protein
MAQVPVASQTVFPEQGFQPQASGADFGAQLGQAQEGLGEQTSQVGDEAFQRVMAIQGLKNEATANDLDVQFQGDLGALEGKFYALKGKDQADAYPQFQQDIAALRQRYIGAAPNPMVQGMLGQSVGYSIGRSLFRAGEQSGIATKDWMIQSADGRNQMLVSQGARNYADPDYQQQVEAALDAGAKNYGELNGLDPDSTALYRQKLEDALQKQRVDNAKAYLQGLPIAQQTAALLGVQPGTPSGVGGDAYHRTVLAVEFGSGQNDPNNPDHQGPVQASPDWWKQFGRGGNPNNPQDALKALDLETSVNKPQLESALGRPVTDGDLYLAHQQGLTGAIALLTHPDLPASQSVGLDAVAGNIPHDANGQPEADANTITGQQFADLWQKPFTAAGANGVGQGTAPSKGDLAAVAVLPPNERQALTADALKNWRVQADAAYTDQQHQQEAALKLQKQQLDTADSQIQQLMLAHDANPSAPAVNLLQVAQSPLYQGQPDRIRTLMAFQKSLDRPDPVAPGDSARVAQQTFARMGLPQGDPNKITSMQQINDLFAPPDGSKGSINKTDLKFLQDQFNNGQTADGQRLLSVQGEFLKGAEKMIDPSSGAGTSPFAAMRYYAFTQAVAAKVQAFRAAGKDPALLFDPTPGNKDYVGSPGFMHPYTRSLTDIMTEATSGVEAPVEGQPGQASTAPGPTTAPAANAGPAIPPDLPKGTTYYGMTKDGRPVYLLPDGSKKAPRATPQEATAPVAPVAASTAPTVPLAP